MGRYIPTTTSIVCLDIIIVKGGVNTQESLWVIIWLMYHYSYPGFMALMKSTTVSWLLLLLPAVYLSRITFHAIKAWRLSKGKIWPAPNWIQLIRSSLIQNRVLKYYLGILIHHVQWSNGCILAIWTQSWINNVRCLVILCFEVHYNLF